MVLDAVEPVRSGRLCSTLFRRHPAHRSGLGRERLQIVLPRTSEPVTLGHLRQEIASITALPYEKIKLIHRGLIMRDDRLPLTAYGLVEGSRIGLVGSREGDRPGAKTSQLSVGEQKAREKKAKEQDTSESGLMNRITEALDSAKLLFPEVEQLEAKVEREGKAEGVEDTHRRVSELLLRQLLALDSVAVNSDTTRQARKVQSSRCSSIWTASMQRGPSSRQSQLCRSNKIR